MEKEGFLSLNVYPYTLRMLILPDWMTFSKNKLGLNDVVCSSLLPI